MARIGVAAHMAGTRCRGGAGQSDQAGNRVTIHKTGAGSGNGGGSAAVSK